METIRAGFVGFGEVNSPREIIEEKCSAARKRLEQAGLEIVAGPPVSDDPEGNDAKAAIELLEGKALDVLIACIAGWIPAHTVVQVADRLRHIPMVLWGLSGYTRGGRLITTAD